MKRQRGGWWRWIRRAVLAGATTTVLVAWGVAVAEPLQKKGRPVAALVRSTSIEAALRRIYHRGEAHAYWMHDEVELTARPLPTRIALWSREYESARRAREKLSPDVMRSELDIAPWARRHLPRVIRGKVDPAMKWKMFATGWPTPALSGVQVSDPRNVVPAGSAWLIEVSVKLPWSSGAAGPYECALPLRPIWPSFLLSTLAYSAIFAGFFALGGIRRARRVRAGCCGACGYDLRGLGDKGACPECGEGVMPTSGAST